MNDLNFSVFERPAINTPFCFSSSAEVYDKMKDYNKASREMFLLLFLNAKNNVIKIEPHTIGTVDSSAVYPREIFKSAILNDSSSIICVHNHPSGDPDPSQSDRIISLC
jgi:DNA repair proteins